MGGPKKPSSDLPREVKLLTKREMLILIRNDMLRELCVAEVNVKDIKNKQTLDINVGINPELTANLTRWETTVKNMNRILSAIDGMIKVELMGEKKKRFKN